jgi:glycosyltransferase involved in cell wall biosynthesis
MHVVIDGRIINSTTGRYIERLITYLEKIDHTNQYTILVPSKDLGYWKPTNPNFTVRTADFANYSVAEQTGLNKLLKSLKPDLVHFCMPQQPVLYKGKVVTTLHDFTLLEIYMSDKNWLVYKLKQKIGYFVFKKVIKKSDCIITDAEFTKKKILAFSPFAKGKTTAIHLATDNIVGGSAPYKLKYKQYLLYVGQQADHKNIRRLGDAHQKLLEIYPDLGLVLVGKKDESARRNEAYFNSKQYKNILFTGFVSDEQLNWLYSHATVYTFPSIMEGFGLPGLEAMEHGTPVISSNATCLPEVYGDAAHYFDPYDTDDMVRAITEVLGNEKLRTTMSQKGYEQIKKYSWKKTAEQTHAVYMKVLKAKN